MILKKNVGYIDSVIRATLGVLIVLAGVYFQNWWGFLGLILVFSGGLSFCPIYKMAGIDTSRINSERAN